MYKYRTCTRHGSKHTETSNMKVFLLLLISAAGLLAAVSASTDPTSTDIAGLLTMPADATSDPSAHFTCADGTTLPLFEHIGNNRSLVSVALECGSDSERVVVYHETGVTPVGNFVPESSDRFSTQWPLQATELSPYCVGGDSPTVPGCASTIFAGVVDGTPTSADVYMWYGSFVGTGPRRMRSLTPVRFKSITETRVAVSAARVFGDLTKVGITANAPVAGNLTCGAFDISSGDLATVRGDMVSGVAMPFDYSSWRFAIDMADGLAAVGTSSVTLSAPADDVVMPDITGLAIDQAYVIYCAVLGPDGDLLTRAGLQTISHEADNLGVPFDPSVGGGVSQSMTIVYVPGVYDTHGVLVQAALFSVELSSGVALSADMACVAHASDASDFPTSESVVAAARSPPTPAQATTVIKVFTNVPPVYQIGVDVNITCTVRRVYLALATVDFTVTVTDAAIPSTGDNYFVIKDEAVTVDPATSRVTYAMTPLHAPGSVKCDVMTIAAATASPPTTASVLATAGVESVTWEESGVRVEFVTDPIAYSEAGMVMFCVAVDRFGFPGSRAFKMYVNVLDPVAIPVFVPSPTGVPEPTIDVTAWSREVNGAGTVSFTASSVPGYYVLCEARNVPNDNLNVPVIDIFTTVAGLVPIDGVRSYSNFNVLLTGPTTVVSCVACGVNPSVDRTTCSSIASSNYVDIEYMGEFTATTVTFTSSADEGTATATLDLMAVQEGADSYAWIVALAPGEAVPSTSADIRGRANGAALYSVNAALDEGADTPVVVRMANVEPSTTYSVYVFYTSTDMQVTGQTGPYPLVVAARTSTATATLTLSPEIRTLVDGTAMVQFFATSGSYVFCDWVHPNTSDPTAADVVASGYRIQAAAAASVSSTVIIHDIPPMVEGAIWCAAGYEYDGGDAIINASVTTVFKADDVFVAGVVIASETDVLTDTQLDAVVSLTLDGDLYCLTVPTSDLIERTRTAVIAGATYTMVNATAGVNYTATFTFSTAGTYSVLCTATSEYNAGRVSEVILTLTAASYSICVTAEFSDAVNSSCGSNNTLLEFGSVDGCQETTSGGAQGRCFPAGSSASLEVVCDNTGGADSAWTAVYYSNSSDCTGVVPPENTLTGTDSECLASTPFARLEVHCAGLLTYLNISTVDDEVPPLDVITAARHDNPAIGIAGLLLIITVVFWAWTYRFAHIVAMLAVAVFAGIGVWCESDMITTDTCAIADDHVASISAAAGGLMAVLLGSMFTVDSSYKFNVNDAVMLAIPSVVVLTTAVSVPIAHTYITPVVGLGLGLVLVAISIFRLGAEKVGSMNGGARGQAYVLLAFVAVIFYSSSTRADGGVGGTHAQAWLYSVAAGAFAIAAMLRAVDMIGERYTARNYSKTSMA